MQSFDVPPSNKQWKPSLLIKCSDSLTPYAPWSDFHLAVGDFPILLLEVNSNFNQGDENCMLVQGACLIWLGNVLLNVRGPSDFMVKAIYINSSFEAIEYTLFQRQVAESVEQHPMKVKKISAYFQMTMWWQLIGGQLCQNRVLLE